MRADVALKNLAARLCTQRLGRIAPASVGSDYTMGFRQLGSDGAADPPARAGHNTGWPVHLEPDFSVEHEGQARFRRDPYALALGDHLHAGSCRATGGST